MQDRKPSLAPQNSPNPKWLFIVHLGPFGRDAQNAEFRDILLSWTCGSEGSTSEHSCLGRVGHATVEQPGPAHPQSAPGKGRAPSLAMTVMYADWLFLEGQQKQTHSLGNGEDSLLLTTK